MRYVSILLVCVIAACSSDDGSGSCPTLIRFVPDGTPTFLAARDPGFYGSGSSTGTGSDWQIPDLDADGTYHMCAKVDVEIVEVCAQADGSFTADEFLALAAEVAEVSGAPCNVSDAGSGSGSGSATVVTVSGSVSDAGTIAIGTSSAGGSSSPWDYTLDVAAGTYDVIASSGFAGAGSGSGSDGGLLAILRGTAFGSDTTLDVDMSTGVALQPVSVSLVNAGSDALSISTLTEYVTETTVAEIAVTRDPTLLIAPQTAVAPNEGQVIDVVATDATGRQQTVSGGFGASGGSATFSMLGPIDGATFGSGALAPVTWDVLPPFSTLQYELVSGGGLGAGSGVGSAVSVQRVSASESWQEENMAKTLEFDTTAPGYDASWNVDTTKPYGRELEIALDSSAEELTSAVIEVIGAPASVVPTVRGGPRAAGHGDRGGLGGGTLVDRLRRSGARARHP